MAWFLRAVELPDGQWSCRSGLQEHDLHADLADAIAHLQEIARSLGPSELFVHARDGAVVRIGRVSEQMPDTARPSNEAEQGR